jgi:hypothetical protein
LPLLGPFLIKNQLLVLVLLVKERMVNRIENKQLQWTKK